MHIKWNDGDAVPASIGRDGDKAGDGMRILLEKDGKVWDIGRIAVNPSNLLACAVKHLLNVNISEVVPTKKAESVDAFVNTFIKDHHVKYLSNDKKPYCTERYLFRIISTNSDFEQLPCECKFNYSDIMGIIGLLRTIIPKGKLNQIYGEADDDDDTKNVVLAASLLNLRKEASIQKIVALCLAIDKACKTLKSNNQSKSSSISDSAKPEEAVDSNSESEEQK